MSENVEKNRSHWDSQASTYNSKFEKTLAQIIKEIRARREFIGVDWVEDENSEGEVEGNEKNPKRELRLLDYACGPGTVSKALAPYVTQCVGMDLTEGMVKEYNTAAQNQGLSHTEMHAVQGNLLDPLDPSPAHLSGPEYFNFDIAMVCSSFHHFDDPALAAKRIGERLKKGGVLVVLDFLPHGNEKEAWERMAEKDLTGDGRKAMNTVTHFGFSEEEIKGIFEIGGCLGDFGFLDMGTVVVFRHQKDENGGHAEEEGHGHAHAHEHGGHEHGGHGHEHGHGGHGHSHGPVDENGDMKRNLFIARGTKI